MVVPWILLQTRGKREEAGLRTEKTCRGTWNLHSTYVQHLWYYGKTCLGILCLSCPPPIHQTTDQICNNNRTDPVQYQLFFDGSSNYVPLRSSIKCQSCKQSLWQRSSGCHRRTSYLLNYLFDPHYNACYKQYSNIQCACLLFLCIFFYICMYVLGVLCKPIISIWKPLCEDKPVSDTYMAA